MPLVLSLEALVLHSDMMSSVLARTSQHWLEKAGGRFTYIIDLKVVVDLFCQLASDLIKGR